MRFKFFDLTVNLTEIHSKIELDDFSSVRIKTRKILMCGARRFISLEHYDKNLDIDENDGILDTETFWKEKEHYYFYGRTTN